MSLTWPLLDGTSVLQPLAQAWGRTNLRLQAGRALDVFFQGSTLLRSFANNFSPFFWTVLIHSMCKSIRYPVATRIKHNFCHGHLMHLASTTAFRFFFGVSSLSSPDHAKSSKLTTCVPAREQQIRRMPRSGLLQLRGVRSHLIRATYSCASSLTMRAAA